MRELVSYYKDVGVSVLQSSDVALAKGERRAIVQISLGYPNPVSAPVEPGGTVLSYPCDGSKGVDVSSSDALPSLVPGRDLDALPLGRPIYLRGNLNKTLIVKSALVQDFATGNMVALLPTLTMTTYPDQKLLKHEALIVPDSPLRPNTPYNVSLTGTNDGVAFTKSFLFFTGAN